MSLSVLIVACNEEARLGWCITAAREYADEIVVVVQQSSDRTLDLAMELADVVLEHPRMEMAEFSRGDGIAACSKEWVLVLDADECLTAEGIPYVRFLMENPNRVVYGLRRLTVVGGTVIEDGWQLRLTRPRDWDGVANRSHCGLWPAEGVSVISEKSPVLIMHDKTTDEQMLDHARYHTAGFTETRLWPEWKTVPWCVRHKERPNE